MMAANSDVLIPSWRTGWPQESSAGLRTNCARRRSRAEGGRKVVLDGAKASAECFPGLRTPQSRDCQEGYQVARVENGQTTGQRRRVHQRQAIDKAQIGKFRHARLGGGRASGSANPNDPYYWRWLEFGHKIVARDTGQAGGGVYGGPPTKRKTKTTLGQVEGLVNHRSPSHGDGQRCRPALLRPAASSRKPSASLSVP